MIVTQTNGIVYSVDADPADETNVIMTVVDTGRVEGVTYGVAFVCGRRAYAARVAGGLYVESDDAPATDTGRVDRALSWD